MLAAIPFLLLSLYAVWTIAIVFSATRNDHLACAGKTLQGSILAIVLFYSSVTYVLYASFSHHNNNYRFDTNPTTAPRL